MHLCGYEDVVHLLFTLYMYMTTIMCFVEDLRGWQEGGIVSTVKSTHLASRPPWRQTTTLKGYKETQHVNVSDKLLAYFSTPFSMSAVLHTMHGGTRALFNVVNGRTNVVSLHFRPGQSTSVSILFSHMLWLLLAKPWHCVGMLLLWRQRRPQFKLSQYPKLC